MRTFQTSGEYAMALGRGRVPTGSKNHLLTPHNLGERAKTRKQLFLQFTMGG